MQGKVQYLNGRITLEVLRTYTNYPCLSLGYKCTFHVGSEWQAPSKVPFGCEICHGDGVAGTEESQTS